MNVDLPAAPHCVCVCGAACEGQIHTHILFTAFDNTKNEIGTRSKLALHSGFIENMRRRSVIRLNACRIHYTTIRGSNKPVVVLVIVCASRTQCVVMSLCLRRARTADRTIQFIQCSTACINNYVCVFICPLVQF